MMKLYRMSLLTRVGLALLLALPTILVAQDAPELAPVSRTYAITNVNIVQAPGRKIDMGTVIVKDGLIHAVGKNVNIPADAIIIKADSMYVYAGFIDGLSRVGVAKPKDENQPRPRDPGNPKPEEAGITPYQEVRSGLNPADKSMEELRNLGFTTAQVVPYGGMMPGNGAIIFLNGQSADNMVLVNRSAFYSELTPANRVYPATVMGVMAKYRELYRQASQSRSYETMYATNRNGLQPPASDRVLESLYPVLEKRQPVLFKSQRVIEAQRVLTLQNDLGFSLMMGDVKEGWDIINKVKAANAKVFLTLDLPDETKKEDAKKDDKSTKEDTTKPKTAAELEKEALEKRKEEFIAKYTGQAAAYNKAGVKFGFSTLSVKTGSIQANLRRMIAAGLSEDAALASLTIHPAEMLGLSDRLGSIDNGKIANLVISDKPYFNEKSKVRYVFVQGSPFKMEIKEAKKGDANAKADASGSWVMTVESPQGKSESNLTIKKDGTNYTGNVSGGMLPQPVEMADLSVSGNALSFKYTVNVGGQSLTVNVDTTLEGDTFKGTASVAQFGSFPVEGKRNPK